MHELKINNSKKKGEALWEKIPCTCKKGTIIQEHPYKLCTHCKCKLQWLSVPQTNFIVKNKKGKDIEVKEILLKRGKLEEPQGWEFLS